MSTGANKPVRLSGHARGYLTRRGFTEVEVINTIGSMPWRSARGGRLEAEQVFPYNGLWNGVFYANKRVRPVFVDNPTEIVFGNGVHVLFLTCHRSLSHANQL